MEIVEVRENLCELPDLIYEAEVEYVNARALYEYLEDMKKHILSTLKEKQEFGSNPERESRAYASDEYRNHLKGIMEASIETGVKGAKLHKLQNKFEASRSLNKNIL